MNFYLLYNCTCDILVCSGRKITIRPGSKFGKIWFKTQKV